MNILVVEDRGAVSCYLSEALQAEGHVVLEAYNINNAQAHWDHKETTPIDCMVVDLHIPPDGLTEMEKEESCGGVLTGWLWLRGYVLPNVPADYRGRVIICSDYLRDFRDLVPADQYRGVRLVPKRAPSGSAAEVLEHLADIARTAV